MKTWYVVWRLVRFSPGTSAAAHAPVFPSRPVQVPPSAPEVLTTSRGRGSIDR